MEIFIDTAAFYALVDSADANHQAAVSLWSDWGQQYHRYITSNYVLLESFSLIQRRHGLTLARYFYDKIAPACDVEWITPQIHQTATNSLLISNRRLLSLVDCSSFTLMRALGLRHVFTFDAHFAEQGFTCHP
jgi:predicted nucleic acid-binding protein